MAEGRTSEYPSQSIGQAVFDDKLLDFAIDADGEYGEEVDRFWSGIYYVRAADELVDFANGGRLEMTQLQVTPVHYDLHKRTVGVSLRSFWFRATDLPIDQGPVVDINLGTDGFASIGNGNRFGYSENMIPHIRHLLAHTALYYASLDT